MVSVTVYPADDPVEYTLSGGDNIFDFINVDDDLEILVNGASVYTDGSASTSIIDALTFEATRGDTLTIRLSDVNPSECALSPLVLWFGTESRQALNDQICLSTKPANACYDPSYAGAPSTTELEYTIDIP